MIITPPRLSSLSRAIVHDEHSHYDKVTEALSMLRGILGTLNSAVYPDTEVEVHADEVTWAVEAAVFFAAEAQCLVDSWHNQLEAKEA